MKKTFKLVVLIRADNGQESYVQIGQATEEEGGGGRYLNFSFWKDQGDNELLVIPEGTVLDMSALSSSQIDRPD